MGIDPRALTKTQADNRYMQHFGNESTIIDPQDQFFFHFNLVNDGTDEATWPDRWMFSFGGVPVSWFNEYTEFRLAPAKKSTIPFRIFSRVDPLDDPHNTGVSLFEIVLNRVNRDNIYRIDTDGNIEGIGDTDMDGYAHYGGDVTTDGQVHTDGGVTFHTPGGPTSAIPNILVLDEGDPLPTGTANGTIVFYRGA